MLEVLLEGKIIDPCCILILLGRWELSHASAMLVVTNVFNQMQENSDRKDLLPSLNFHFFSEPNRGMKHPLPR